MAIKKILVAKYTAIVPRAKWFCIVQHIERGIRIEGTLSPSSSGKGMGWRGEGFLGLIPNMDKKRENN